MVDIQICMTTSNSNRVQPDWTLYRTFLSVMREGSLSAAARDLALTQPTVGRHIEALEASLGVALFSRSPTGLTPTTNAQALLRYTEELDFTTAAIWRAAARMGEDVQGTVRISCSEVIGVEVLPPMLAQMRQQWPRLTLEVKLSDRLEDLLRRDADIAVRMVRPTQEALLARHVGTISVGLHATQDYLARCGTPQSWADLAGHTLIGFDTESPFIRAVQTRLGGLHRGSFALRADSNLLQMAAMRAGFGIGICQLALGRRYGLVPVMAGMFDWPMETWIAMHGDLREDRACGVVFAGLGEGLVGYCGG